MSLALVGSLVIPEPFGTARGAGQRCPEWRPRELQARSAGYLPLGMLGIRSRAEFGRASDERGARTPIGPLRVAVQT